MKNHGGKINLKLRELQKVWYRLLEQSGFKDVEELRNGELVLKVTSTVRHRKNDAFDCRMEEEYFRCLYYKVNDENTIFQNDADKTVMKMHVEGFKIKDIVAVLKENKTPRDRYSVRIIIRRYEMSWGIKNYTRKQLHMKCS